MKKMLFPVALAATLFLVACGSGDSPKVVAEKFLNATQSEKYDEAKTLCTEETGKMIDMMASFAKNMPAKDKKTEKLTDFSEKIDGDAATVTYKSEGKEGEQSIKLKKTDGKWLVSVSKADMSNKGGDKPKDEPAMEGHSGDSTPPEAATPATVEPEAGDHK